MKHKLTCSALAWLLLASSAHAQSRDMRPSTADVPATAPSMGLVASPPAAPVPVAAVERMRHPDGREGRWVDDEWFDDALEAPTLEAGYLEQLSLASRRLALREQEAGALRLAASASSRRADELRGALRGERVLRLEADASASAARAWRWVFGGIGVAIGAAVVLLTAWAVGETR